MGKRFVSIWFRYLKTDWVTVRRPELVNKAFVLSSSSHGRMIISAANALAQQQGAEINMTVADARTLIPSLLVMDDKPDLPPKLLPKIAAWCIRFSPIVALDPPSGLLLDVTGCTHLWGGDEPYSENILKRFREKGYQVRIGMADTIGCAWAIARFGTGSNVIEKGRTADALLSLPSSALRLEPELTDRLYKLGLRQVNSFIQMPVPTLRRRFGDQFIKRLQQALGREEEIIVAVLPAEPFEERLFSPEPIVTATGIEIAIKQLLEKLCRRLQGEQKGLRKAIFSCYRVDGKVIKLDIGTNRASHHAEHLFKLFEIKLSSIEPDLGIELFALTATIVEGHLPPQELLWERSCRLQDMALSELLDRIAGKVGPDKIHRYLPDEHYWPERSVKKAGSLHEKRVATWMVNRPRPLQLLSSPHPIMVTAPIPDYPPMLFRYKGKLHKVVKADGPERIEQEWWLQQGQHRDYYRVEDEEGSRYWLFRSGHYADKNYQWFIHGFFA
jgi:protein ImuB